VPPPMPPSRSATSVMPLVISRAVAGSMRSRLQVTMDLYVHAYDDVRDAVNVLGKAIS